MVMTINHIQNTHCTLQYIISLSLV